MTTDWTDRLSEYLDDTLTPAERRACEAWLGSSADGRALLEDLRRVVAKAKTLPDVPVPESVWQGVAAGIRAAGAGRTEDRGVVDIGSARAPAASTRRWSFTPVQFAAAAILVLAVGVAAGLSLRARRGEDQVALGHPPRGAVTTGTVAIPVASRANESYDRAVNELQLILDRNRSSLDTGTVRVLTQSLAKIDAALSEAQEALAKDPKNAYLNDHLSRIKRKKLDLLRQGASLVQAS